jgi:uncharacterized protein YggE
MHDWRMHPYYSQQATPPAVQSSLQTITVTGQGTFTVKPDTVIITLGIRTEHTNAQEALSENARRANTMIQALQAIGVRDEDIDTASFSIYPKYNYTNTTALLVGYEVEHIFDITVKDVKKVGHIYETAVASGANIARHIQFKLANEQPYYQQALAKAVKNAQEKAVVIARAIGIPLHEIPIQMKEESISTIVPPSPRTTMVLAEQQTTPPIQAQDIIITAIVQAVFTY